MIRKYQSERIDADQIIEHDSVRILYKKGERFSEVQMQPEGGGCWITVTSGFDDDGLKGQINGLIGDLASAKDKI